MERHMTLHRLMTCGAFAAAALSGIAYAADVGGRPLYANLTGAAEIDPQGDLDGSGTARVTVNPGKDQVCWELTVSGIAPAVAAHIHSGNVSSEGGVVVALTAPTNGASSGCATVSDELAEALMASPADYYVNVHTADFPDGAVRGQLSSKKLK